MTLRATVAMDEGRVEALAAAMALAPSVYTRNRMFDFFRRPAVRRARTRASLLRGVVPQLARASGVSLGPIDDPRAKAGAPIFVLRFSIPTLRMSRVVELSRVELATLRLLAWRAGCACLPLDEADRATIAEALGKLLESELAPEHRALVEVARDGAR